MAFRTLRDRKRGGLPVRSRRIVGESGTRLELMVPCRERGFDVTLEACDQCERCEGLHGDAATQTVEIACRRSSDPPFDEASDEERRDANTTPVSAIMNTDVVCLEPDLDVAAIGPVLLSMDVSGAAVVDADGRPIGVLTQSDVLRWRCALDQDRDPALLDQKVAALMTTPPLCLGEADSIAKAAALMAFENIHRIPVVDVTGELTGMLSPLDVLRWLARENGYVVGPSRPR